MQPNEYCEQKTRVFLVSQKLTDWNLWQIVSSWFYFFWTNPIDLEDQKKRKKKSKRIKKKQEKPQKNGKLSNGGSIAIKTPKGEVLKH